VLEGRRFRRGRVAVLVVAVMNDLSPLLTESSTVFEPSMNVTIFYINPYDDVEVFAGSSLSITRLLGSWGGSRSIDGLRSSFETTCVLLLLTRRVTQAAAISMSARRSGAWSSRLSVIDGGLSLVLGAWWRHCLPEGQRRNIMDLR
jgi:hypothetical protein